MDRGDLPALRALPRVFVPGASSVDEIQLPKDEIEKFRRVLRLSAGDFIAVLPNNGTVIRCEFTGRAARPLDVLRPEVEPSLSLTLAQALPKGDKLDEIVRACASIGVCEFVLFPSDRSVVRWDAAKAASRLQRLGTIAQEACEVSFRTRLPSLRLVSGLSEVLSEFPDAFVMSEAEGLTRRLPSVVGDRAAIVVGPEGGWSPSEMSKIGDRGFTLGPRILRVDHAGPATAALLLLRS